jgi:hypothetical protein
MEGKRITVELAPAADNELERLRKVTGCTTGQLFRYALSLLRIYVEAKEKGQDMRLIGIQTVRIELPIEIKR